MSANQMPSKRPRDRSDSSRDTPESHQPRRNLIDTEIPAPEGNEWSLTIIDGGVRAVTERMFTAVATYGGLTGASIAYETVEVNTNSQRLSEDVN